MFYVTVELPRAKSKVWWLLTIVQDSKSFLLALFSYQLITFTVQLFNNANSSNWQYLPSPAFQIDLSQGFFHTGLPMKWKLYKYFILRKLLRIVRLLFNQEETIDLAVTNFTLWSLCKKKRRKYHISHLL